VTISTPATTAPNQSVLVRGLFPETSVTAYGQNGQLINLSSPGSDGNPNFTGQVTFEESHHDEMEIVDHPIEQGAPITDHTFKRPAELTIRVGWSESPLPNTPNGLTSTGLQQIYQQLLAGQANRILYSVLTGKRLYTSMLIKSLAVQTDAKSENVLLVTIGLRQLILVSTQTVSVSATPEAQAAPQVTNPAANLGTVYLQSAPNYTPSPL